MRWKDEVNVATYWYKIDIRNTPFSIKQDEENEHVSKAHVRMACNAMEMCILHANEKITVPSGRQEEPIKQLIQVAKETDQTEKNHELSTHRS